MSHQDWTPVVFNKKSNSEKDKSKSNSTVSSSSSSSLSNVGIYKAASDEDVKNKKYVASNYERAF